MHKETVTEINHWSEKVFTFKTTRSPGLRFKNGEFTMVGLIVDEKPLLRAYSIASANHEDYLEFLSIKVPDGALTGRLQNIQLGDEVLVGTKPVGTLTIDYLLPGETLYMFATGTGLAPFLGVIKDPETYDKFENLVLVHSVKEPNELVYAKDLYNFSYSPFGEFLQGSWEYKPIVTGPPLVQKRITTQILSGVFPEESLNPDSDRIMVCGSPQAVHDLKTISEDFGFTMGSNAKPGTYTVEKAFVEK